MGTSSSSSGPGAGVPFDPPWLSSVALENGESLDQISDPLPQPEQNPQQTEQAAELVEIAPRGRFGNARRHLGQYISTGDQGSLKKALGSYSRKGMGGASKVAKRMRFATSIGARLYNFLQGVRDSSDINVRDWVNQLSSKILSVYEVAEEIINQVLPTGGSLEEESCRNSMAQAMSDLLVIDPEVDLLNMDNENIWVVMELFIANEAFNRLILDIGQIFESSKYSPREAVLRMNDMRDYLKSEIAVQFQALRADVANPTKAEMNNLLQAAIKNTFEVFEEEI